jgi:hypothetical protein
VRLCSLRTFMTPAYRFGRARRPVLQYMKAA